jgi:hypothetical protein
MAALLTRVQTMLLVFLQETELGLKGRLARAATRHSARTRSRSSGWIAMLQFVPSVCSRLSPDIV